MAVVIYVGVDTGLMKTRKLLLEQAGHTAFAATNERELLAWSQHQLEVAILSETLSPRIKRGLLSRIRSSHPTAKVLELYPHFAGKSLEDADAWLEAPVNVPSRLANSVRWLAIKAATHRAKELRQEAAKMKTDARNLRSTATFFRKTSAALMPAARRRKHG